MLVLRMYLNTEDIAINQYVQWYCQHKFIEGEKTNKQKTNKKQTNKKIDLNMREGPPSLMI